MMTMMIIIQALPYQSKVMQHRHNNKNNIIPAQKQTWRQTRWTRKPRFQAMQLQSFDFFQSSQKYTLEEKQYLQQMLSGKLGVTGDKWSCTKINFQQIKKNPPYKISDPGGAGREDKRALWHIVCASGTGPDRSGNKADNCRARAQNWQRWCTRKEAIYPTEWDKAFASSHPTDN